MCPSLFISVFLYILMSPRTLFSLLARFCKKLSGRKLEKVLATILLVFPGDGPVATAFFYIFCIYDCCSIVSLTFGHSVLRCSGSSIHLAYLSHYNPYHLNFHHYCKKGHWKNGCRCLLMSYVFDPQSCKNQFPNTARLQ